MAQSTSPTELSLGLRLKQAREQQGWTVEQVAAQLKLLPRMIESLETDNYAALPEAIFIKGYLRLYADLLALPTQELCAYFDAHFLPSQAPPALRHHQIVEREISASKFQSYPLAALSSHQSPSPHKNNDSFHSKPVWPWLKYVLLIALLVAMAIGVWQSMSIRQAAMSHANTEANLGRSLASNTISLPNVTSTRSAIDVLQLAFTGQTKVVIRDASGNELANATKQAGESLTVQGESPFAIELNPADSVQFSFNNKPIDLKPYTVNGVVNFRLSR